jgi:hypothetical protein
VRARLWRGAKKTVMKAKEHVMATSTRSVTEGVDHLVEALKSGAIMDAFEALYADNVSMGENHLEPTVGKDANRTREEQFLATVKDWKDLWVNNVAVNDNGDGSGVSFIEYGFRFVNQDDQEVVYQQASRQNWEGGRIVNEVFYHG